MERKRGIHIKQPVWVTQYLEIIKIGRKQTASSEQQKPLKREMEWFVEMGLKEQNQMTTVWDSNSSKGKTKQ